MLTPDFEATWSDEHINATIVTEFDLVCSRLWLKDTIFALGNVGLAIGENTYKKFLTRILADIISVTSHHYVTFKVHSLAEIWLKNLVANWWCSRFQRFVCWPLLFKLRFLIWSFSVFSGLFRKLRLKSNIWRIQGTENFDIFTYSHE